MNRGMPPKIAVWLVERFGSHYKNESLAGDLIEEFQQGESRWWVWRQVVIAIFVASLARFRRISLLPVLRLLLRIAIDAGVVLALCAVVDQSRRTHSAGDLLVTPNFMATISFLAATVAGACGLLIWMSRRERGTDVITKVVAAVAAITLGFGALTWAATTRAATTKAKAVAVAVAIQAVAVQAVATQDGAPSTPAAPRP